jgi:purine-cytosine permease-like protein
MTNSRKEERLLNFVRQSVWFVVLIAAVIAVAFILSILPQEIRWILFILSIAFPLIQIIRNSFK